MTDYRTRRGRSQRDSRPTLAYVYLTDSRHRSAGVPQTLEMCEALEQVCQVRFYHPAISKRRLRRELDYWDVKSIGRACRVAAFGPSRSNWVDYPNRVAFLGQVLLNLRLRPVDVIYTRDPSLLYFIRGLPARLRPGIPIMYEAHKLYHRVSARVDSASSESRATHLARHVIAISPGVREDLVSLGVAADRIDVLPLGVKLGRFDSELRKSELRSRLGLRPTDTIIVYSGSWEQWKGVETLVEAFERLAGRNRDAMLLIAGAPAGIAAALRSRLADSGLHDKRVRIHEHLSRRELVRWLLAADIGVVPNSNTVLGARYTSPLKVFEYLAAGLALVVSDLPSLRFLLTDSEAVFARPDDPLDLADKLSAVLDSEARRLAMQRAAKNRAPDFDNSDRARRIIEIYREFCRHDRK